MFFPIYPIKPFEVNDETRPSIFKKGLCVLSDTPILVSDFLVNVDIPANKGRCFLQVKKERLDNAFKNAGGKLSLFVTFQDEAFWFINIDEKDVVKCVDKGMDDYWILSVPMEKFILGHLRP